MRIIGIEKRDISIIMLFLAAEMLFLLVPFGIDSDTDIRYFLSATSQTLAALFALVFTIVLVVGQMASVHSNRLFSLLFDRITVFYMFFFAFSVIFPLIVLKGRVYKQELALVSGTFAIGCIVDLIPFVLSLKEDLRIESLIDRLSKESIKKINSELEGGYKEYHLSEWEKEEFWEEIMTIESIAFSAWNRKDFDSFRISLQKLLWIITEIRNWETIQKITIELRDIGENVISDTIAIKILMDAIRDSFPKISENEKGYPITELLGDYAYLTKCISDSGSPISLQHSLENYEEIGNAVIEKENDDLVVLLLETFEKSYKSLSNLYLINRGNIYVAIGRIGVLSAEKGLKNSTKKFLLLVLEQFEFYCLLSPPFSIIDKILAEARIRKWEVIITVCQDIRNRNYRTDAVRKMLLQKLKNK
jgi:hypothetical protein